MSKSVNVLVLEDNKNDEGLLIYELRRYGYTAEHSIVSDKVAFLKIVTNPDAIGKFDIVLADYSLPGYNALAALMELRNRDILIPFIVVTGSLEDDAAVDCIKQGATDYLLKDRLHRLGPAVERALEEREEALIREQIAAELETTRLQAAKALEAANIELEKRIDERTKELTETNQKLMDEISQRERIQQALNEAQKMKAIGHLSAGVAHHFNNLLTVVIGNLEMVMVKELDPVLEERLGAALHASRSGARLTKQLLSFSRQQIIQPELVEPSLRLSDTGVLLTGLLRDDLQVEIDIPDSLWPIRVDFAELELAILNLAFNARDALAPGGTVRLTAANHKLKDGELGLDGLYVLIEVSDDGEGIPPDVMPHVFDPFFTTKEVGTGSGLGLSQVHGFVHQAGGTIDIQSKVGKGTAVRMYLPVMDDVQTGAQTPATTPKAAAGSILVVDDEVLVAQLSGHILAEDGFEVELAYRGEQALDFLRSGRTVDLLISDVVMPGMSGVELADYVRDEFPDVPILLVTGHTEAHEELASRELPLISKPFEPRQLRKRVASLLKNES